MHYRATTIFSTDIRLSHYLVDSDIQDETNVLVCERATSAVKEALCIERYFKYKKLFSQVLLFC